MTLREAFALGKDLLKKANIEEYETDAWLLLEAAAKCTRNDLYLRGGEPLSEDQEMLYQGSTPRSMSALERKHQVPALTPHKVLGPGIDGTGIPRGPRATRMGTGLSRGHQSRSLRSPSEVESTCHNSRKSRRFSPPGEMRPISAEASQG